MDLALSTITNVTFIDEICYSFALHSSGDNLMLLRTKNHVDLLRLKNDFANNEIKFQLSAKKIKVSDQTPSLKKNEMKIFDTSSFLEKHDLMLDPYKLTESTLKDYHYIKALLSPFSIDFRYKVACLTSTGIIELHSYYLQNDKIQTIEAKLNELVKADVQNTKEITKYSILEKCLKEITFCNFEWAPVTFGDAEYLLAVTKSDKIYAFKLNNTNITIEFNGEIDKVSAGIIKWVNHEEKNYLFVTTEEGNYKRYSIVIDENGKILNIKEIDIINGQLEVPVTSIFVDAVDDALVLLCTKTHSVEILYIKERKVEVLLKYIDLCVTGATKTDELEYLLCTLNSKIYMLRLQIINDSLAMKEARNVNIVAINCDNVQSVTKYNFHGITASKNKVLIYICGYPQLKYDHLVIKQPVNISVNLITSKSPCDILTNNSSRKLTEYADVVEAIRFTGSNNLEAIDSITDMPFTLALNDEFSYYLKLQYISLKAKSIYYKTKSHSVYEIIDLTFVLLTELLKAISSFFLMKYLLASKSDSPIYYATLRSLENYLHYYCTKPIEREPFKQTLKAFAPQMQKILKQSRAIVKNVPQEVCTFCFNLIDENKLECRELHNLNRCLITNLPIALDCENYCEQCNSSVTSKRNFIELFGSETSEFLFCSICDSKFIFQD